MLNVDVLYLCGCVYMRCQRIKLFERGKCIKVVCVCVRAYFDYPLQSEMIPIMSNGVKQAIKRLCIPIIHTLSTMPHERIWQSLNIHIFHHHSFITMHFLPSITMHFFIECIFIVIFHPIYWCSLIALISHSKM